MYVLKGLTGTPTGLRDLPINQQPQVELPNPTFDPSVWGSGSSSLNQMGGSAGPSLPGSAFPTIPTVPGIPGMTLPGMPGYPGVPAPTPWWQGPLGIVALVAAGLVAWKVLSK